MDSVLASQDSILLLSIFNFSTSYISRRPKQRWAQCASIQQQERKARVLLLLGHTDSLASAGGAVVLVC